MFGIDSSELLLVAIVALVVIGPKDLPKAMRVVGYWVGKARGVTRQFRSGFDAMVREAELAELEKRWAAENERIMRDHPATSEQDKLSDESADEYDIEATYDTEPQGEHAGEMPAEASGDDVVTVDHPEVVPAVMAEPEASDTARS